MGIILPTQGKVVSFVDREADIALAAQSIFSSRFHFGGKCAYATEIIFIHEAAMDIFKRHLAQLWIELSFSRPNVNRKQFQQEIHRGFVALQAGSQGAVIEVQDRLGLRSIDML
jgi:acyl-CoA reductase-like NAD-dependent aldehyde dehydrogenase